MPNLFTDEQIENFPKRKNFTAKEFRLFVSGMQCYRDKHDPWKYPENNDYPDPGSWVIVEYYEDGDKRYKDAICDEFYKGGMVFFDIKTGGFIDGVNRWMMIPA